MRQIVIDTAKEQDITLRQGVYAWWTGPTYETPAEIRMIRTLGADAVGMSTVPEALIARHSGIDTIGISCLTNMACGILEQPLSHDEVIETAERVKSTFLKLISEVIARL
ncbi:Purine nucleoside phosphorylase 1 [Proteus vulgaris]|nr:Purine nucleoside phosphorylase 1 [Proteus vulgaris]